MVHQRHTAPKESNALSDTSKQHDSVRYLVERPENGTPKKLFEGIYWLRLALPFALDHVNLWLLRGDDGWTLIDTGYANDQTRQVWEQLLADFLSNHPIRRVIATHFHPDHAGLAGWLGEKTGASLAMTRTEWLTARMLKLDESPEFADAGAANDRRAGIDPELIRLRQERGNLYRHGVSLPHASYEMVKGGQTINILGESWQVIIGEGHAPEMITLYNSSRNLLIAADQILPRISPVVGVWAAAPDENPLADFMSSLDRFTHLPEDCTVLPSHDGPFEGLHYRVRQLKSHHQDRLAKTLDVCREPHSLAEIMPHLFKRKLDLHNTGFALGEALAHVNFLVQRGELTREFDSQGVWHYARG